MDKALSFENVTLWYSVDFKKGNRKVTKQIKALDNISFDIEFGETVGVIGENGSGKSTLLKLIAGFLKPNEGDIIVNGRAAGILEVGAGFDRELTGRENIQLLATIYGFSRKEIETKIEEIINFADVGDFIDAPVKYYSSGMFVRLGFSIAIHLDPEILLIDDTIAIGDEEFQRKCLEKISQYKKRGKTIVCVSHALSYLENICKKIVLLEKGKLVKIGAPSDVISFYIQNIGKWEKYKIQNSNCTVLFNRGRIHINYKNRLVTSREGAYFILYTDNYKIESFKLTWKLIDEDENFVKLKNHSLGVEFSMNYEKEDKISFFLDGEKLPDVEWVFFLSPEYKRWVSENEEGDLKGFDFNTVGWEHLYHSYPEEDSLLLFSSSEQIPTLMFNLSQICSAFDIFNSDVQTLSRIVVIKIFNKINRTTSSSFKICFGNNSLLNDYQKQVLPECKYGDLKISFKNNRLSVFWKDKEIISDVFLRIFDGQNWYNTIDFEKIIRKKDETSFQILCCSHFTDVKFILDIKVQKNRIKIDVQRILSQSRAIFVDEINIFVSSEYKKYFLQDYRGEFCDEFSDLVFDHLQGYSLSNDILLSAPEMPWLLLKKDSYNHLVQLLNSDYRTHSRIITFTNTYPESLLHSPGIKKIFDFDVHIYASDAFLSPSELIKPMVIKNGDLSLELKDKGWIPIYKNTRFSKIWHFYSSLRVNGIWYDSTRVNYNNIRLLDDSTLEAELSWKEIPIIQYWKFELFQKGIIWDVIMRKIEDIKIDRWQLNIMLSELYDYWISRDLEKKEKDVFPEFKNVKEDWEQLKKGPLNSEIGVESSGGRLPSLWMKVLEADCEGYLAITNSNGYFRARLLQWICEGTKEKQHVKLQLKFGGE